MTPPSPEGGSAEQGGLARSIEDSIAAVLAGDREHWPRVVADVHRRALALCARRFARRGDDFASNVALRSVEKLCATDFAALRRFQEQCRAYPTLDFARWVGSVIHNAAIDELRALPTVERQRSATGRQLVKREHVEYAEHDHSPAAQGSMAKTLDARRFLACVQAPDFPGDQRQVLLLWLQGHSATDSARALGVAVEQVHRTLRAARQRLRRAFEEHA